MKNLKYLELIYETTTKHRFTIAPGQGRVTIKYAIGSSKEEIDRVYKFFKSIFDKVGFNACHTERGSMDIGEGFIVMYNNAKTSNRKYKESEN